MQVVDNLGAMFIGQLGHRLEFQDDFLEANDVWDEGMLEPSSFVEQWKLILGVEWDAQKFKFSFKTFLIDGFSESAAFDLIDLKARTTNAVRFVRIDELAHGELGWPTEHTEYAEVIRRQK